ncbi:MAG: hypothetical protein IT368_04895 [Candidatus Hydrogenedentes bacterium]|nr:hypothetical protein [Candidatus Hydrogenedentota bacterium]
MLVAEQVFDRVLSPQECQTIVEGIDFAPVATHLAEISNFIECAFDSSTISKPDQWKRVQHLFTWMFRTDGQKRALKSITPESHPFAPLSPQAIYATLELSGRFSPRTSRVSHLTDEERERIAHVILSFQSEALSSDLQAKFRPENKPDWVTMDRSVSAEFIRNRIANNPNRSYAAAISRLYAFAKIASISAFFLKHIKVSVSDWFQNHLGMTCEEYLVAAVLAGTPGSRYTAENPVTAELVHKLDEFFQSIPQAERERTLSLLEAASIDADPIWKINRKASKLSDQLYEANTAYIQPIIRFPYGSLIVSKICLWNQFMVGLPHSSLNLKRARQGKRLSDEQVQEIRGGFGHLLEGYMQWLILEWFGGSSADFFYNYQVLVDGKWAERDIAVLYGDTLYLFEIKGKVHDLRLRESGSFEAFGNLVEEVSVQVFQAAAAFISGGVKRADSKPLPKFLTIIPIALIYDPIPLNVFTGDHFDPWLEQKAKHPLFRKDGARHPVQLLGLEDLEDCERTLRLDLRPENLLDVISIRAQEPEFRYKEIRTFSRSSSKPICPAALANLSFDALQFVTKTSRAFFSNTLALDAKS